MHTYAQTHTHMHTHMDVCTHTHMHTTVYILQCLTKNKVKRPSAAKAVTTKKGNLTLLACPSEVSHCCFLFHSGTTTLYTTRTTARPQTVSQVGMRVTWSRGKGGGGVGEGQGRRR